MDKKVISDYMIEQNRLFHKVRPDYGSYGNKWAKGLQRIIDKYEIETILDYGAGKQTLKKSFPDIQCYDPGILEISNPPESADLVLATHVLEHIEPDLLENVLTHIQELTRKVFFIVVDSGKSDKIMPDGRDSNLIQESVEWWFRKLHFGNFQVYNLDRKKFIRQGEICVETKLEKGTFIGVRI